MTGTSKIKSGWRGALAAAAVVAVFALPAQALAQSNDCSQVRSDPSAAQYCPQSDVLGVDGNSSSGSPTDTTTTAAPAVVEESVTPIEQSGGSSLPFTGLDVGVLVAAAAILFGTGLALRRFTVSPSSKE